MLSPFRNPDSPTRSERRRVNHPRRLEKFLASLLHGGRSHALQGFDVPGDDRPMIVCGGTDFAEQFWYRAIPDI